MNIAFHLGEAFGFVTVGSRYASRCGNAAHPADNSKALLPEGFGWFSGG
jgi:hypothetical protein